jgi:NADH-quinone oxidoreductase subunit N
VIAVLASSSVRLVGALTNVPPDSLPGAGDPQVLDPNAINPSGVTKAAGAALDLPKIDWTSVAPILTLVVGAFVLLVASALLRNKLPKPFMVTGTIATAVMAGLFTIPLWHRVTTGTAAATFANALNVDGFGLLITFAICSAIVLASLAADDYLRREQIAHPEFFVLMLLSGAGGVIMANANDFIVLFLGLEILSIALYVLAGSHVRKAESQESALKYFVLGAFSSAVLLMGIAFTYGGTGSTNFSEIRSAVTTGGDRAVSDYIEFGASVSTAFNIAAILLIVVGLGFKVAAVPFHMWTPDVYQGSPSPATGFMAAAAKAAGFAGLLRVMVSAFGERSNDWQPVIWVLAVASMLVGSILAVMQNDVKRMMAYSSISHAGFILIGLEAAGHSGNGSSKGVTGAVFYLIAYTFIVLGSFTIISIVGGRGDRNHSLDAYNGLGHRKPALALAFTLFLLAQAGVPATSGFMAKFGVISAAVDVKSYPIAIIAMLSAVIAASFYLRIVMRMYTGEPVANVSDGAGATALHVAPGAWLAIVIAAAATLLGGIVPQLLLHFADRGFLK